MEYSRESVLRAGSGDVPVLSSDAVGAVTSFLSFHAGPSATRTPRVRIASELPFLRDIRVDTDGDRSCAEKPPTELSALVVSHTRE
ncbi:hypothetical protein EA462_06650 [Natrarchaeobius halalkaliphilus]|uniref:Uncharacterized protein n=1 Tax=Natrarchaeobius halalkaliphilus TaxID=1679091 RepID=A0A3N6LVC0_9EURY|nr:hypothetical protein EA462_06650 [Natrarchaeobius halalkaliphilus]